MVRKVSLLKRLHPQYLKGWSFGFRGLSDRWQDGGSVAKRTLEEIDLIEVFPFNY